MKKIAKLLFSFLLIIPFAFLLAACGGGNPPGDDPPSPPPVQAAHTVHFWVNDEKIYSFSYNSMEDIYKLEIPGNIYYNEFYYVNEWYINTPTYQGPLDIGLSIDFMSLPKEFNAYGTATSIFVVNQEGIITDMVLEPESLNSLTIPTHIKDSFVDCDIVGIESFRMLEEDAPVIFDKLIIPNHITYFGERAFDFGKNVEVVIEDGNQELSIENNCVVKTQTSELLYANTGYVLPQNLQVINAAALAYKEFDEDFTIPRTVHTIKQKAFEGYNLETLIIPNTVRVIEYGAFKNSRSLKTVIFEENSQLECLEDGVFELCQNLEELTIPFLSRTNSQGEMSNLTRLFKRDMDVTFDSFSPVKKLTLTAAKYLSNDSFWNKYYLEEVYLPNTLNEFDGDIFYNCNNIKKIVTPMLNVCPRSVKEVILTSDRDIKEEQFKDAENLESVILPEGVKVIGNRAFNGCLNLTEINLPSTITTIGESAFDYSGLATINVPEATTYIGARAFKQTNLQHFEFPKNITTVEPYLFEYCEFLTTVVLNEKIENIKEYAFWHCENLEQLNLPSSLKIVGESAIGWCVKLAQLNLPSSLEYIGNGAFARCEKIENVVIPRTVKYIGSMAFHWCLSLKTATIESGATIETLGTYAFSRCEALESFVYPKDVTILDYGVNAFEYCISLKTFKYTGTNSYDVLYGCSAVTSLELENFEAIHDLYDYHTDLSKIENLYITNMQEIEYMYYIFTGVKTLRISDKIKSFSMSPVLSIENIIFEGGLTSISENAFKGFTNLKSIILPNGLTAISNGAFEDCTNLTSITMPDVVSIGDRAFSGTGLKVLQMPENLIHIGKRAFANSQLETIITNQKIEVIDDYAFYNCKLTQIELPISLNTLGDGVYAKNNITNIISRTTKFITDGKYLLDISAGENNKKIIIYTQDVDLQNITKIGPYAFKNQTFTTFIVPQGVNYIGEGAFESCENLEYFAFADMQNTDVVIGDLIFKNTPNLKVVKMPFMGSDINTAKAYSEYFNDSENIALEEVELYSAITLAERAFLGCNNLTSITVTSKDTESILEQAFANLTNITEIDFGNNVKIIDNSCFINCTKLSNINFGKKLEKIGSRAFEGTKLFEIILPSGLTTILGGAFTDCTNLNYIYIPNTVTQVGEKGLTSIVKGCSDNLKIYCQTIKSEISKLNWQTSWNYNKQYSTNLKTYYYCLFSANNDFIISSGTALRYIGTSYNVKLTEDIQTLTETFNGNKTVQFVTFSSNLKTIGENAFNGCINLKALYIPKTVKTIFADVMLNSGIENIFVEAEDLKSANYSYATNWNKVSSTKSANFYIDFSIDGYNNRTVLLARLKAITKDAPNFSCTLQSDGIILTSFNGTSSDKVINIPNDVIKICNEAFISNPYITHVYIPNSVKTIEYKAFKGCTSLQFVHIGNGIESVLGSVLDAPFSSCSNEQLMVYTSLTKEQTAGFDKNWDFCFTGFNISVVYEKSRSEAENHYNQIFETLDSVEALNDGIKVKLFYGYIAVYDYVGTAKNVILPETVTAICDKAFANTGITSIELPNNLKYIGDEVFFGTNLKRLYIPKSVSIISGTIFDKNSTCKIRCGGYKSENWATYWNYKGKSGTGQLDTIYLCYYILDKITGNEVLCDNTGKMLEYEGDCVNVVIPKGVKFIGNIFEGNNEIETLYIPNTVETLEERAFASCDNLRTVDFEENCQIKTLPNEAFAHSEKLEYFYIPDSVTELVGGVFMYCDSLEFVYIPKSVKDISSYTTSWGSKHYPFDYNNEALRLFIADCEIPTGWCENWNYQWSGNYFYYEQSIYLDCEKPDLSRDYVLSSDKTGIRAYRITHSNNIVTPTDKKIYAIGDYALYRLKNIDSFELTDNITELGNAVFYLAEIPYIVLPETVKSITGTTKEEGLFYGYPNYVFTPVVESPVGWGDYWQSSKTYLNSYIDENGYALANGGKTLVKYYGNSENLIFPDTVEEVVEFPEHDFVSIKLPNLKNIYGTYFNGKKSLKYVELGNGVQNIYTGSFRDCTSLTTISIPDGVTSIGNNAFENCTSLTTIIFNDGIQSVGEFVFKGCTALENVYIPSTITEFGKYAFYGANPNVIVFSNNVDVAPTGWLTSWCYYNEKNNSVTQYLEMTLESFYNREELFKLVETYQSNYSNFTFGLRATSVSILKYLGSETEVIVPEGVTSIENSAFSNNKTITKVTLPDTTISIGSSAFNSCSALQSINLDNIRVINASAFANCTSLKNVNLFSLEKAYYYSFTNTQIDFMYIPANAECLTSFFTTDQPEKVIVYVGFAEGTQTWNEKEFVNFVIKYNYTKEEAISEHNRILSRIEELNTNLDFEYGLYYGEIILNQYTGEETVINNLPNDISYINSAFYNNKQLTEITIPASVKKLVNKTFYDCTSLSIVRFENNSQLKEIGDSIFYNCTSLSEISLPNGLEIIGYRAFYHCKFTEIILPQTLVKVDGHAFGATNLKSIIFPEGVVELDDSILGGFESSELEFVYLPSTLTYLPAISGVSSTDKGHDRVIIYCNFEESFGSGKIDIYFEKYYHKFGYTLEEALQDFQSIQNQLAEFASQGFEVKMYRGQFSLVKYTGTDTKVVIPSSITRIENGAFYQNKTIEELDASSVTYIDKNAFYYCSKLATVKLSDKLTYIGSYAFAYTGLTEITIPELITIINQHTFDRCQNLTKITLPENLLTISDYAFTNAGLVEIKLPSNLVKIGSYAFQSNKFTTLVIPNSVTTLSQSAFHGCVMLQSITLSESLTAISTKLFYNCESLTEIVIPENVKSINKEAFFGCNLLANVIFEGEVSKIEESAFSNCHALTEITLPSSLTELGAKAFFNCTNLQKVFIPKECVTILADGLTYSPFYSCSQLLIIYTDADEALEAWSTYWNAVAPDVYANVVYNANGIPDEQE